LFNSVTSIKNEIDLKTLIRIIKAKDFKFRILAQNVIHISTTQQKEIWLGAPFIKEFED
jgi:hypothetical protein